MSYVHSLKPVFSMGHVVSKNTSCKEVHLHTQRAIQFYMSYFSLVRVEQQKDNINNRKKDKIILSPLSPLEQTPLSPSADTSSKC